VRAGWEGLDAQRIWDGHCHLAGNGDSGSGIYLNQNTAQLSHPLEYAQRYVFMNAACASDAPGRVDASYVERLSRSAAELPPGAKLLLLAFDANVSASGEVSWGQTSLYVPDAYAATVARRHAPQFEWAASVHPYRHDSVARLEVAVAQGARALKWLPATMGIDPASSRCDAFYAALARLDLPLITHAGLERALRGADAQAYGNPLHLRRALDHGVRVVVAHCASMGVARDLDRGANGPERDSFELFARLMDEPRAQGRLYGDISAMTQTARAGAALEEVIRREDWHARLLYGSDYPLPGVFPLFSLDHLVRRGFVEASAEPILKRLREYNPLLFSFVLARSLRSGGKRFGKSVFETRDFFLRRGASAAIGGGAMSISSSKPRSDPQRVLK